MCANCALQSVIGRLSVIHYVDWLELPPQQHQLQFPLGQLIHSSSISLFRSFSLWAIEILKERALGDWQHKIQNLYFTLGKLNFKTQPGQCIWCMVYNAPPNGANKRAPASKDMIVRWLSNYGHKYAEYIWEHLCYSPNSEVTGL